jgi:hypothetical protein
LQFHDDKTTYTGVYANGGPTNVDKVNAMAAGMWAARHQRLAATNIGGCSCWWAAISMAWLIHIVAIENYVDASPDVPCALHSAGDLAQQMDRSMADNRGVKLAHK